MSAPMYKSIKIITETDDEICTTEFTMDRTKDGVIISVPIDGNFIHIDLDYIRDPRKSLYGIITRVKKSDTFSPGINIIRSKDE